MTTFDWSILVPAIVALLTAVAAYLKAHTAGNKADAATVAAIHVTSALQAHLDPTVYSTAPVVPPVPPAPPVGPPTGG